MKLLKTVIVCDECQMPYYKTPWEPMWLVKLAAKDTHSEWHDMALNPETTPLAIDWRRWERERIIKLLEEDGYMLESDKNHAIALIKGEQK